MEPSTESLEGENTGGGSIVNDIYDCAVILRMSPSQVLDTITIFQMMELIESNERRLATDRIWTLDMLFASAVASVTGKTKGVTKLRKALLKAANVVKKKASISIGKMMKQLSQKIQSGEVPRK